MLSRSAMKRQDPDASDSRKYGCSLTYPNTFFIGETGFARLQYAGAEKTASQDGPLLPWNPFGGVRQSPAGT